MSSVRSQEQASRPSPELERLLNAQSELRALENKLASIERAIEPQNEKIEKARAAAPLTLRRAIEMRIGDLLASEAAGLITEREREEREAALNKEAAKVRAAAADASAIVSRVQATIEGLDAQLRNVKAEIARAKGKCHIALDALLMSEAECLGRAYLELAKGIFEKYLQLLAIDSLHRNARGPEARSQIRRLNYERLFLPAFATGGHDADAVDKAKSFLFTEGGGLDRHVVEATSRERARLEAVGVVLTSNSGRFCDGADTDESAEEERSAKAA